MKTIRLSNLDAKDSHLKRVLGPGEGKASARGDDSKDDFSDGASAQGARPTSPDDRVGVGIRAGEQAGSTRQYHDDQGLASGAQLSESGSLGRGQSKVVDVAAGV
jgi:hypothetical protein